MPNTKTSTNSGYTYLTLLGLIVLCVLGAVGFTVYRHTHTTKKVDILGGTSQQNDFAGCIRAGGSSSLSPVYRASETAGIYQDGLRCSKSVNSTIDFAEVTLCTTAADCQNLKPSAIASCAHLQDSATGKNVSEAEPETKYPVVKNDYGRIDITKCASNQTSEVLENAVAYYHLTDSEWRELFVFTDTPKCSQVDHKGVPLELLFQCLDGATLRAPK